MFFMKWKALAACTLAGLALIAAGCGGGDKAAAGGCRRCESGRSGSERQEVGDVCVFP